MLYNKFYQHSVVNTGFFLKHLWNFLRSLFNSFFLFSKWGIFFGVGEYFTQVGSGRMIRRERARSYLCFVRSGISHIFSKVLGPIRSGGQVVKSWEGVPDGQDKSNQNKTWWKHWKGLKTGGFRVLPWTGLNVLFGYITSSKFSRMLIYICA